jgi:excisionase family DNA binding protein
VSISAPEKLLKPIEVAAELRVTVDSVYRLIASGRLRALRIGEQGPLRVPAAAVDELLRPARPTTREAA